MTQVRGDYDKILQTIGETVSEVVTRWELEILQKLRIEGSCDAAKKNNKIDKIKNKWGYHQVVQEY